MLVSPGTVRAGSAGHLYIANSAFISMRRADGSISRLISTNATHMSARAEGGVAIVRGYIDVQLVNDAGQLEFSVRNPHHIYGMAARTNGKVALLKYNGDRYDIDEFDTVTGTRRIIATPPRSPDFFGSDLSGNLIYCLGSEIYRIDHDDVAAPRRSRLQSFATETLAGSQRNNVPLRLAVARHVQNASGGGGTSNSISAKHHGSRRRRRVVKLG